MTGFLTAGIVRTALEVGLIYSLVALSLFISYSILNICDLSTDGCYTLGCAVGAIVTIAGHPFLAIPAAMLTMIKRSSRPARMGAISPAAFRNTWGFTPRKI